MPNQNMYAISRFAYVYVLPLMTAYEGGRAIGGPYGGILAILGTCGLMASNLNIGLFGAMLFAPIGGYLWKYGQKALEEKAASSMQMLGRNLCIGISGGILAAGGFYAASPLIGAAARAVYYGVDFLVEQNLVFLLSILIEPAKVFFLNNVMNHGILVPLGMNQVQELGQSCLFLLESNPGPGLGMLAALWYVRKGQRNEYVSAIFAESIGGIHEVYFPFVLGDLWLLVPLIFGGIAGSLCFEFLHVGLQSAVSPGSVITILLLAGKKSMAAAAVGILVSAAVAFTGSVIYLKAAALKGQKRGAETEELPENSDTKKEEQGMMRKEIRTIGFVCDGGMGSSAMGAAIFRRTMAKYQMTGIQVEVFAADLVEDGLDLIVCQEDFARVMPDSLKEHAVYTVTSFLKAEEYEALIEQIEKSRG